MCTVSLRHKVKRLPVSDRIVVYKQVLRQQQQPPKTPNIYMNIF